MNKTTFYFLKGLAVQKMKNGSRDPKKVENHGSIKYNRLLLSDGSFSGIENNK